MMDIVANILDPIHDGLDPRVFDQAESDEPKLKQAHRKWVIANIHKTLKDHGYTHSEQWLTLVLTGSLTTYQYGEESDFDVSLFVDSETFPEWSRAEMIGIMVDNMDGTILPGTPFPMQCFVVSPTVSREDLYKPGLRSGYDIDKDEWIVPPDPNRVMNVDEELNGYYVYALEAADKMDRLLRYEPDKAEKYWHQIHIRRFKDQKRGKGDYSLSNIVYKFLSKRGLFPRLAEATGEHIAKTEEWKFSALNHHYHPWTGLPCNCGYGQHKGRTAGQEVNKLLKTKDKVFQTPEGKAFLHALATELPEESDRLAPWLAMRYKEGDIQHDPEDVGIHAITYSPYPGALNTPSISQQLPEWTQWFNARNHPTRRGINIMDKGFGVSEMNSRVLAHQNDLAEKAKTKRLLEGLNEAKVVHKFDNGWTVRRVNDFEHDAEKSLEAEGEAMNHCIGDPNQQYREPALNGDMQIYSLRDPKNQPHMTWNMNQNGTVGETHGNSNSTPKPEYQKMYQQWCDLNEVDPDEVGTQDGRGAYDEEYVVRGADDMDTYMQNHGENGEYSEIAYEDYRANIGEDTMIYPDVPNIGRVAEDYVQSFYPDARQYLGQGGAERQRKEFFDVAMGNGYEQGEHWDEIDDTIKSYPATEPHEIEAKEQWEKFKAPHYNPFTGEVEPQGYGEPPAGQKYQQKLLDQEPPSWQQLHHPQENPANPWKYPNYNEPANKPLTYSRAGWTVDPRAVDKARAQLGLKLPVNVKLWNEANHRYDGAHNGTHQVNLTRWVRPEAASASLWHELAHAKQWEDNPEGWDARQDEYYKVLNEQGDDARRALPEEVEARGAGNPFPLVLPNTRESKTARPADPEWWGEQDPYVYHVTTPRNAQSIAQNGLHPWDHPSLSGNATDYAGEYYEPRPNHVYLRPRLDQAIMHMNTMPGHDFGLVKIDRRKLDPKNINADEDVWEADPGYDMEDVRRPWPKQEEMADPDDPTKRMLWPNRTPPSLGQQAEELGIGDNPLHTQRSYEQGAIAHRGPIPKEAIERVDYYPASNPGYDGGEVGPRVVAPWPKVLPKRADPGYAYAGFYGKTAAGQVAKFVYEPVLNTIIIGTMGAPEGEVYSHNQLVQGAGFDPNRCCYGEIASTGYVSVYSRPKIQAIPTEVPSGMNQYEVAYRTEEAVRRAVPGAKVTNPQELLNPKWELRSNPSIKYVTDPPVLDLNAKPESDDWAFS